MSRDRAGTRTPARPGPWTSTVKGTVPASRRGQEGTFGV